jgi:hypothetical protein
VQTAAAGLGFLGPFLMHPGTATAARRGSLRLLDVLFSVSAAAGLGSLRVRRIGCGAARTMLAPRSATTARPPVSARTDQTCACQESRETKSCDYLLEVFLVHNLLLFP